jgi:hypothetical protein
LAFRSFAMPSSSASPFPASHEVSHGLRAECSLADLMDSDSSLA